jgi:Tfp pilus assembly PilM family ATPase
LARLLAIDWDQEQLLVVSAVVGPRGVRIQRAAAWKEEQSPNPADAEALGRLLRDRLKAAGIAPAPALICVGRDRVILKDIRYPFSSPEEEPALVRFQAAKELTHSPEEVVIDYAPANGNGDFGERRALALILRRELLATYQDLCRAAGLKLVGVTPRPFGSLACWQRLAQAADRGATHGPDAGATGLLTVAEEWAEFCVVRSGDLALCRSLTPGQSLPGEVRRNLSVYAGQNPEQPLRALYLAGADEQGLLRARLQDLVGLPVHELDPLAGAELPAIPAANRGAFAGAVGLLYAYAARQGLSINFVRPKQPRPPRDPNKRRLIAAALAIVVLVVGTAAFCLAKLAEKDQRYGDLFAEKTALDSRLVQLEEDAKRIDALDAWAKSGVVWLDELYDLTDCFPDTRSIQLINLTGVPRTHTGKDNHVAKMSLRGITTEDYKLIEALMNQLGLETHYRLDAKQVNPNTGPGRPAGFRLQFTTGVDIEPRPPNQFIREVLLPAGDERSRAGQGRTGSSFGDFPSFPGGGP